MQVYGKILQSKKYEPRHIIIQWYKIYDTKTVVAKTFGYILCTTVKPCLWLTI